jgi:hypothetical protein
MNAAALLRRPLVLLFAAELIVVSALVAVGLHLWQGRQPPAVVASEPPSAASSQPANVRPPRPTASAPGPPSPPSGTSPSKSGPGFRTDAAFLTRQMRDLNRDQANLEGVEWRLVKGAIEGMRQYLESVVLPAVERAQRGAR